jgi:N12 class adenine-specific DNA methylase
MRYVNSIRDVDSAEAEQQYKEYVKDIALSMFETSLKELNTNHNPGKQLDGKGNPVSAINQLALSAAALKNGFTDQRWVTFKQLQELGGRLPRGTHGTKIVSWQWKKTITTTDENGEKSSKEVWLEKPIKKTAVVFNLSQCQLSPEILAKLDEPKQQFQQSSADAYIQNNQMPAREQSEDPAVYYHNAFSTVASGSISAELPSGVAPIHTDLATRFIEDAFNFNSSDADLNIVDSIRNYDEQLAAEGLSDAERAVRIVDQISDGIIQANKVSNRVRNFISQQTPQQPVEQVTAAVISAEEQKKYIGNEGKAVSGLVENDETAMNQYQYSDEQEQVAEQAQQPTVAPQLQESKNATKEEIRATQEKAPNAPDQTLQDALKLQQEQLQKQFAEAMKQQQEAFQKQMEAFNQQLQATINQQQTSLNQLSKQLSEKEIIIQQQQAQIQSMETLREEPPQVQEHPAENSEIQISGQQNDINDISTEQSQREPSPSIFSDIENKKFNLSDSDNYIKLVSFLAVKDFERKNMVKLSARGLEPKPFTPEMKKQFIDTLVSLSQECKDAGQQPAVMATSDNMLNAFGSRIAEQWQPAITDFVKAQYGEKESQELAYLLSKNDTDPVLTQLARLQTNEFNSVNVTEIIDRQLWQRGNEALREFEEMYDVSLTVDDREVPTDRNRLKEIYESGRTVGYFQTIDYEKFEKINACIPISPLFNSENYTNEYTSLDWDLSDSTDELLTSYNPEKEDFTRADLIDGIALNQDALNQVINEGTMPPMVYMHWSEGGPDLYPEQDWQNTRKFKTLKDGNDYLWMKNLQQEPKRGFTKTSVSVIYPDEFEFGSNQSVIRNRYDLGDSINSLVADTTRILRASDSIKDSIITDISAQESPAFNREAFANARLDVLNQSTLFSSIIYADDDVAKFKNGDGEIYDPSWYKSKNESLRDYPIEQFIGQIRDANSKTLKAFYDEYIAPQEQQNTETVVQTPEQNQNQTEKDPFDILVNLYKTGNFENQQDRKQLEDYLADNMQIDGSGIFFEYKFKDSRLQPDSLVSNRASMSTEDRFATVHVPSYLYQDLRKTFGSSSVSESAFTEEISSITAAATQRVLYPELNVKKEVTVQPEPEATIATATEQTVQESLEPSENIVQETTSANATEPEKVMPAITSVRNFDLHDSGLQPNTSKSVRCLGNLEATKLLREINENNLYPTDKETFLNHEQLVTLSNFSGWGGLAHILDPRNDSKMSKDVKAALTEDEFQYASENSLTAYHTPTNVIDGIYTALKNMNFKGGYILEPSCGTGRFIGCCPEDLKDKVKFKGVELDPVSGQIAKCLYPDASITVAGFETIGGSNKFDAVIGNVPFGKYYVNDPKFNKLNFTIHNYFLAKSLDQVKPGGVIALMTTHQTMDSQDNRHRLYLAQRGELLGAIRMPGNTFDDSGTNVISDILFIKKRDRVLSEDEALAQNSWVDSLTAEGVSDNYREPDEKKKELPENYVYVNSYFTEHPEMVVGSMTTRESRYNKDERDLEVLPPNFWQDQSTVKLETQKVFMNAIAQIHGTIEPIQTDVIDPLADEVPEWYQSIDKQTDKKNNIFAYAADVSMDKVEQMKFDPKMDKMKFFVQDNELYYHTEKEHFVAFPNAPASLKDSVIDCVNLRDAAYQLINMQLDDLPKNVVLDQQKVLNDTYNQFVAKHDRIFKSDVQKIFRNDSSVNFLMNLENTETVDEPKLDKAGNVVLKSDGSVKTQKVTKFVGLADMFTELTISPNVNITQASNATDALNLSVNKYGFVNLPYMAELVGTPHKYSELISELGDQIFIDPSIPLTEEWKDEGIPGMYVTRSEYLSGNIPQKIKSAEKAGLTHNVEELQRAMPKRLTSADIKAELGNTWIPAKFYNQFIKEELTKDCNHFYDTYTVNSEVKRSFANLEVEYCQATGSLMFNDDSWVRKIAKYSLRGVFDNQEKIVSDLGIPEFNAISLMDCAFKMENPVVYAVDENGKPIKQTVYVPQKGSDKAIAKEVPVRDNKKTIVAEEKLKSLKAHFENWIWSDRDRTKELEDIFNARFNSFKVREYDGSNLTLPGHNTEIKLHPHQLNAIARMVQGSNNTLLAHEVGAGKTFEMIAAAMESKRLGKCNKSMLVVPNHLVVQTEQEFRKLYPAAKLMVGTKDQLEGDKKVNFFSRVAASNCDAVIIPHKALSYISVSPERKANIFGNMIDDLNKLMASELYDNDGHKATYQAMIKRINALKTQLNKAMNAAENDSMNGLYFEQLGVDKLFVDEAHEFKNLSVISTLNVKGMKTIGSAKAMDLYTKTHYLNENGKNAVVFATGTPVSNTMTEMFVMQKYLEEDRLKEMDIHNFNSWVSNFGHISTETKVDVVGDKFEPRTSLNAFNNVPELMNTFKEIADIKMQSELNLNLPSVKQTTIAVEANEFQKAAIQDLSYRANEIHSGGVDPRDDNMLKITHEGRSLGLDPRAYDTSADDDPDSKVNTLIGKVYDIYKETESDKLTQVIFCDQNTPPASEKDRDANKFYVYDDIKDKLVNNYGVPAKEIAFIHDYATDEEKQSLFDKVNSGDVRIVIGSTQKMGAGTNFQKRLKALHHLDIGWRPSDIAQRNGRIVRPGNMNKEVEIYNYITKGTFDAYLWQMQESKQKFISQIMTTKSPARTCDELDETVLTFAEVKALAIGDNRIKEKLEAENERDRILIMKNAFKAEQSQLNRTVTEILPKQIESEKRHLSAATDDLQYLKIHAKPGFAVKLFDTEFTDKKEAGKKIAKLIEEFNVRDVKKKKIGSYNGFVLNLCTSTSGLRNVFYLELKNPENNSVHTSFTVPKTKPLDIIDKLETTVTEKSLSLSKSLSESNLKLLEANLEDCKSKLVDKFPQEEELQKVLEKIKLLDQGLAESEEQQRNTEENQDELAEELDTSSRDELIDESEELEEFADIEELSVDDEVENSQKHDNPDDERDPPNIKRGGIRR